LAASKTPMAISGRSARKFRSWLKTRKALAL
jgi:hypothetical protein